MQQLKKVQRSKKERGNLNKMARSQPKHLPPPNKIGKELRINWGKKVQSQLKKS